MTKVAVIVVLSLQPVVITLLFHLAAIVNFCIESNNRSFHLDSLSKIQGCYIPYFLWGRHI